MIYLVVYSEIQYNHRTYDSKLQSMEQTNNLNHM